MQRNKVMHHCSLKAELLLEQGLFSTHTAKIWKRRQSENALMLP